MTKNKKNQNVRSPINSCSSNNLQTGSNLGQMSTPACPAPDIFNSNSSNSAPNSCKIPDYGPVLEQENLNSNGPGNVPRTLGDKINFFFDNKVTHNYTRTPIMKQTEHLAAVYSELSYLLSDAYIKQDRNILEQGLRNYAERYPFQAENIANTTVLESNQFFLTLIDNRVVKIGNEIGHVCYDAHRGTELNKGWNIAVRDLVSDWSIFLGNKPPDTYQYNQYISKVHDKYPQCKVWIGTGHSLGATKVIQASDLYAKVIAFNAGKTPWALEYFKNIISPHPRPNVTEWTVDSDNISKGGGPRGGNVNHIKIELGGVIYILERHALRNYLDGTTVIGDPINHSDGSVSDSLYSQNSHNNSNQCFLFTQNSNDYTSGTPTQNATETPTQNTSVTPTQNTNETPTQNTNETPTQNTNETTTQNTNETTTQNTSIESTNSTKKDYVDIDYGTKSGAEKLENAAYEAISEIEENADKIKQGSEEEKILSWVNTTKEYLGIALELKGWKNLTEKQRTKLATKVLVGELIKREAFAKAFELTSKEVSGIGFILNLATSTKIRVEQVAGQLYTLCSNGFPTGGIVNLITNLVKKTQKFSRVVSQAIQEITTDMICYLEPTLAIAYGIYQAFNIVKELITTRKEIKIGPFSVMSSSRISIDFTWRNILNPRANFSHRHEIDFPLFDIHIVVHNRSKSEAKRQAIEKCEKQMEERCYTYIGIPYSLISGEELDVFKPPIDTKLPIYHTFIKSLWVMRLTSNWQDHHNLTEDQRRTFFLQMQESQEAKDLRLTHQVLGIKSSFFDENKNLNILEYISKFLMTSDFSTRTTTLKAIYHLFFRTGHHKCQEIKLSKPFKAFLSYFGVDVEDFLRYANYMKNMTKDELEKEVDKLKEKESKNFWDFVEEMKEKVKNENKIIKLNSNPRKGRGRGSLKVKLTPDDKKSLRDFELEEMEEIKNSSREELDPHILIVEFLKYLGIDPSYVYGNERLQQIEHKYSTGGRYSRENVLFWLCNEQLGSVFSVGNLFETGVSTGVGMTCSTIAYIDHELPNMYRSPGNYVVSKSAQFSSNYCQNHICKELSKLVNNFIFDSLWRESKSDKFLKCLTTNIYSGISLGVSSVRSAVFDKQNNRSWLDFWYGVAENVVQNNLTHIHEALVSQWNFWKKCTDICMAYSKWLPKFLSVKYGKCYAVELLTSILGPAGLLESGPILSGVMVMLTCRTIKSLLFSAGSLVSKTFGGIRRMITNMTGRINQNFRDNDDNENNNQAELDDAELDAVRREQENQLLRNQYMMMRNRRNRTLFDNMMMNDIRNELIDRGEIVQYSINYKIELNESKKVEDNNYDFSKKFKSLLKKFKSNRKPIRLTVNKINKVESNPELIINKISKVESKQKLTINRIDKVESKPKLTVNRINLDNTNNIKLSVNNKNNKLSVNNKNNKLSVNNENSKLSINQSNRVDSKVSNQKLNKLTVNFNPCKLTINPKGDSSGFLNDSDVKKLDESKNIVEEKILQAEVIGDATPALAEVVRNVVKSIPSVVVVDNAFEDSLPVAHPIPAF